MIRGTRIKAQISKRIDALADNPEEQGKSLGDELFDLRSVKTVKERYRIIYRIEKDKILVLVAIVGIRKEVDKKDVYELIKRFAGPGSFFDTSIDILHERTTRNNRRIIISPFKLLNQKRPTVMQQYRAAVRADGGGVDFGEAGEQGALLPWGEFAATAQG